MHPRLFRSCPALLLLAPLAAQPAAASEVGDQVPLAAVPAPLSAAGRAAGAAAKSFHGFRRYFCKNRSSRRVYIFNAPFHFIVASPPRGHGGQG